MWDRFLALGFLPFLLVPASKALPKCGRRRCPPLGAFNPPPTEGVRSVLDIQPNRFQIRPDQSQRANLKGQALYARPGSCSPLFFSPQEAGDHRNPEAKKRNFRTWRLLVSIFDPSRTRFENDMEKTLKKARKSRILASPSPSKTLPKTLSNRYSKKHTIFKSIFDNIFQKSKPRNLENITFASTGA